VHAAWPDQNLSCTACACFLACSPARAHELLAPALSPNSEPACKSCARTHLLTHTHTHIRTHAHAPGMALAPDASSCGAQACAAAYGRPTTIWVGWEFFDAMPLCVLTGKTGSCPCLSFELVLVAGLFCLRLAALIWQVQLCNLTLWRVMPQTSLHTVVWHVAHGLPVKPVMPQTSTSTSILV